MSNTAYDRQRYFLEEYDNISYNKLAVSSGNIEDLVPYPTLDYMMLKSGVTVFTNDAGVIKTYENGIERYPTAYEKAYAISKQREEERASQMSVEEYYDDPTYKEIQETRGSGHCQECSECLTELIFTLTRAKSQEMFYLESKKAKQLPNRILVTSFPEEMLHNVKLQGEESSMKATLVGLCKNQLPKCVKGQIVSTTIQEQKLIEKEETSLEKSVEFYDLTYQDENKVYSNISSGKGVELMPKKSGIFGIYDAKFQPFYEALNFLLLNRLVDFPINHFRYNVFECDDDSKEIKLVSSTEIISAPVYEIDANINFQFFSENIEDLLKADFKNEGISPDKARYGKFKISGKFTIKYNREELEFEIPIPLLSDIPFMNDVSTILHKVLPGESTKNFGKGKSNGLGKKVFPISFTFLPPVFSIQSKTALGGLSQDSIIHRSGKLACDPFFGLSIQINIIELLSNVGGAIAKAVTNVVIDDLFYSVKDSESSAAREAALTGSYFSTGARVTAFFYFKGTVKFKGDMSFKPTSLSSGELPFSNPRLGGEVELGLYAGVCAEAKLFGFGGSFEAGLSVKTGWEGYYYFAEGGYRIWHKGIWVEVFVKASFKNKNTQSNDKDISFDSTPLEVGDKWSAEIMEPGSEADAFINSLEG